MKHCIIARWIIFLIFFFSIFSLHFGEGCLSPKCNNCPKCNKVLNVITFGPKCNKVLNVITCSPKCNKPLTQSFNSCSALLLWWTPHWYVSDSCCSKKTADQYTCHIMGPLISISVLLDIRNISSRSMVLIAVYRLSWRKSFPAQSGLVLGWKLHRMESIGT